jgi:hypothetical protein
VLDDSDLDRRFSYHAPGTQAKRDAHTEVRRRCRDLAVVVNEVVPDGREKYLAFTKLEEVMFWANAGLARDDNDD